MLVFNMSTLPSPSISASMMDAGKVPLVKLTIDANEVASIEPGVDVFLRIATLFVPWLVIAMSAFPSPSTSPAAKSTDVAPAGKSTFAANDAEEIGPPAETFRKTETVLDAMLAIAMSINPSLSKSVREDV